MSPNNEMGVSIDKVLFDKVPMKSGTPKPSLGGCVCVCVWKDMSENNSHIPIKALNTLLVTLNFLVSLN